MGRGEVETAVAVMEAGGERVAMVAEAVVMEMGGCRVAVAVRRVTVGGATAKVVVATAMVVVVMAKGVEAAAKAEARAGWRAAAVVG